MEQGKLPFSYWLICIELMNLIKKSFSALEMQRMLGHKEFANLVYNAQNKKINEYM
jgi:hypothetical protein